LTSSIQLKPCLAAASGLKSWGLALFWLVVLYQLCATAAAPLAGLAAAATNSPVVFAVAASAAVGMAALKSRKAKAGTFPRRLRAGFQRSVTCKPMGVTRAGDSPASSSKPSASSRKAPLPDQPPSYYEARMKYGSRPRRSLVRRFRLGLQLRRRRGLIESWGKAFTPPSFPAGWKVGKRAACRSSRGGRRASVGWQGTCSTSCGATSKPRD